MNSFAALDSDNEDDVPVVKTKPVKKEAAKAAPVPVVVAPVKAAASSAKGSKVPGAPSAPKVRGKKCKGLTVNSLTLICCLTC